MADRQTKIEIPDPVEGEASATAEQLQFIRQLVEGMSLQGYRFDYRKLGTQQAAAVIDQLLSLNKTQGQSAPTPPTKPRKQGPGCIISLARGTTTLIVWAIVLAGVAGGAYLIHWRMNQVKPPSGDQQETAQADDTPNSPQNNSDNTSRESSIFSGLGASDTPSTDPAPRPNTPDDAPDSTTPDPITPPTPAGPDPALLKQIAGLEELLVKLSQYTRNDFPQNIRIQSSEAMQRKLADFDQAFAAISAKDPALARRISSVIADFAAQSVDGTAVREEIKAIRQALDTLREGL